MFGLGRIAYRGALPRQPAIYVLVLLLAAVALLALGLLIAAVAAGTRVAQGIGTLIFFPLMFFAGLWVPIPTMPNVLRSVNVTCRGTRCPGRVAVVPRYGGSARAPVSLAGSQAGTGTRPTAVSYRLPRYSQSSC
jgi:hypothetical protein